MTITDNHGEVEVPVNPARVVALDNTVLDTLSDWDVELVAAPKGVMGSAWPEYTDDEEVLDVGNHREPNLEVIVGAQPDLIIGGYRFGDYYDDLKAQNTAFTRNQLPGAERALKNLEERLAEIKLK